MPDGRLVPLGREDRLSLAARRKERFERLILPFLEKLHRAAFRLTGNREDAEDLLQETLEKAYRSMDTLVSEKNPAGWAYTIMRNSFLNSVSRNRPAPVKDPSAIDSIPSEGEGPERIAGEGLDDLLNKALMALPEDMRVILVAREVQGLSYHEIARAEGVQEGTVKSRIHRARERLRVIYLKNSKKLP